MSIEQTLVAHPKRPPSSLEADPVAPTFGNRIGRYVVLSVLGRGSMGIVLEAYDPELDRKVALKLLEPSRVDGKAQTRLRREAQALARLNHINVVTVFEVGTHAEQVFVAMEFVRGQTLRGWIESRPTRPWAEVIPVFLAAGRGLAAAHEVGLVHRDFKPENVMIGEDGRVRVMDFGLARRDSGSESSESGQDGQDGQDPSEHEERSEQAEQAAQLAQTLANLSSEDSFRIDLTQTGAQLGTPAYMAPEQFRGEPADARSDQFGFCVALYEALYGRRPFAGSTFTELEAAVLAGEILPAPRAVTAPPWLARLVYRGLSRAPEQRYPSMLEILDELEPSPALGRWTWLAGAGLLLALVSSVALLLGPRQSELSLVESMGVTELQRGFEALGELGLVESQIRELDAAGERAQAQALFEEFVELPAHAGTEAFAQAWRHQGQRLLAHHALEPGLDALATAYVSSSGTDRSLVLLELAEVFVRTRHWDRVHAALDTIELTPGPELEAQRPQIQYFRALELASRRDFPGARSKLDEQSDPRIHAVATALSQATITDYPVGAMGLRPLPLPTLDLDGDGIGELAVFTPGAARIDLLGSASPLLLPHASVPLEAPTSELETIAGGPANLVAGNIGESLEVYQLDADAGHVRARKILDHPIRTHHTTKWARADFDEDKQNEVYAGLPSRRSVLVAEPGPADLAPGTELELVNSVINDLLRADIDGDGTPELAVLAAEWGAYDLRVYNHRSSDPNPSAKLPALELLGRIKLGTTQAVAALPNPTGPGHWLAVSVSDRYPSREVFPAETPGGVPGFYVFAWDGESFEQIAWLDLHPARRIYAGDFDGDGLCDLALASLERDEPQTVILIQTEPGEFTPMTIRKLWPLGAANLDDDNADELIAAELIDNAAHATQVGPLVVLGRGTQALQRLEPPRAPARESEVTSNTSVDFAARVARARHLTELGLPLRAAHELEALAVLAPAKRSAELRLEVAQLLDAQGHRFAAAQAYEAAAVDPAALDSTGLDSTGLDSTGLDSSALPARLRATQLFTQVHRFSDAERTAGSALALATSDSKPDLELERARLETLAQAQPRLEFDFEDPLDPRWILDPFTVRHRDSSLLLSLGGTEGGIAAQREFEWTGERLAIDVELELELELLDVMSSINVEVRSLDDPERALALELGIAVVGGGKIVRRISRCNDREPSEPGSEGYPLDHPESTIAAIDREVSLHAEVLAGSGQRWCRSRAERFEVESSKAPIELGPGRYALQIVGSRVNRWTQARAKIRSIVISGAREPALLRAPIPPEQVAIHHFVEGDPLRALEALDVLDDPSGQRALRFLALDELGRWTEADAALQALLGPVGQCRANQARRDIFGLFLHHEPERLGPVLRHQCGDANYFATMHEVWADRVGLNVGNQRSHAVLLTQTAGLERWRPTTLAGQEVFLDLVCARAKSRSSDNLRGPNVAELERALRLGQAWIQANGDRPTFMSQLGRCRLTLAAEFVARGELEHGLEILEQAIADTPSPEILADLLVVDPAFTRLHTEPRWRASVGTARVGRSPQ